MHLRIGGSGDGPVGKVTSLRGGRTRDRGTILGSGKDFQFPIESRPHLGPTQAPIQLKSEGIFFSTGKWTERTANQPNYS